ncbi:MAG TPA: T9SS type A sorting domain-containing protein [Bacteroidia bacterium]
MLIKGNIIVLLILTLPVMVFSQTTFEKWYDYGYGESGACVQQTSDGGYIIAGQQFITMGVSKNLLIKTDSSGNVTWYKLFGGPENNQINAIRQSYDGGYIMTGQITGVQSGYYDISWLKTDSNGDTLWSKHTSLNSTAHNGWGQDIVQTADSGMVVLAVTTDTSSGGFIWLIKTDKNGDTLWAKTTRKDAAVNNALALRQTQDGGYIICGYIVITTFPQILKPYLVKTNNLGDTTWTRIIATKDSNAGAYFVSPLNNGGYYIGGGSYTYASEDFLAACLNSTGDTIWEKLYGGIKNELAMSGQITKDGGYILAGATSSFGMGNNDVYIVKTDSIGQQKWQRTFGTSSADVGNYVQQTTDGGYIVTGYRISDVYLIKTDSIGNVALSVSEESRYGPLVLIYPNPFNTYTNVLLSNRVVSNDDLHWKIIDILGREIRGQKIPAGDTVLQIEKNNLYDGVYFLQLFSGSQILSSSKIMIR